MTSSSLIFAPRIALAQARRAVALLCALTMLIGAAGCMALPAITMGMQATQVAGVGVGMATEGREGDSEESQARCEQVEAQPPPIYEVRSSQVGPVFRHWVLFPGANNSIWGPDPSKGWEDPMWVTNSTFTPPLQLALSTGHARFLIFAPAQAVTDNDETLELSFAAFPQEVGSFTYAGRNYQYTVAKKLPCFKMPGDK